MNRHLRFMAIVSSLLVLYSCQNRYTVKYTSNDMLLTLIDGRNMEISAPDDRSAYQKAVDYLDDFMSEDLERYNNSTITIEVKDASGRLIKCDDIKTKHEKQQIQRIQEDQKKAYAGANFGMTLDEIKKLDHFRTKRFDKRQNRFYKINEEKVGNYTYTCLLSFDDNDGLESVMFITPWQSDLYYNTDIISRIRDFSSVMIQAYGMPTKSYGIPAISDFYSTTYKKVNNWEVGTKSIEISVQKKTKASEFFVEVIISDHSKSEQRDKQALQDRLENIDLSSTLF